jgi:hypothetical protein
MIPRAAIVAWPLANEELVNPGVTWTSDRRCGVH